MSSSHVAGLSDVSVKKKVVLTSFVLMQPQDGRRTGVDNASYLNDEKGDHQIATAKDGHMSADPTTIVDQVKNGNAALSGEDKKAPEPNNTKTQLYFRRWWVLALFCLFSFSNAFQWIHLNIVADVVSCYYSDSLPKDTYQRNTAIDWLAIVYGVVYIALIFPATWFLDKKGLRISCISGTLINAVGAWLKCASVSPDRFPLLMFAQTICGVAQIWVLSIPPRLAAVWFGLNEVSTATSLGVFGNQLGVAVGFLLPPIIVPFSNDTDVTARGLYAMAYGNAGFATVICILFIFLFRDKPPLPPSRAQQCALKATANENYRKSLANLFKNFGFVILVITYGINTGSYYALSTLLNSIVLFYFPGEGESAGRIGLTIVLAGILASVLAGIWLDKTKTFKGTTVVIYILTIASTFAFTFTLDLNKIWVVFLTAGLLGFFMTGYLPVGFEFAAELTFPEPEGTSSGLLNAGAMVFGTILTLSMRAMLDSISVLSANLTICVFLLVGGIITAIIKPDYRRQEAGKAIVEEITNQEWEIGTNGTGNIPHEDPTDVQNKSDP